MVFLLSFELNTLLPNIATRTDVGLTRQIESTTATYAVKFVVYFYGSTLMTPSQYATDNRLDHGQQDNE
jgi:hypothetical protein